MGPRYSGAGGLHRRRSSPACPASERCCAGATAVSGCSRARRRLARGGGQDRWHGSSDPAGLGDPVQRAGTGRSHQYPFSGSATQAQRHTQGFLARIVRPALRLIESDAVDGDDVVAVDWAECREQGRDETRFCQRLRFAKDSAGGSAARHRRGHRVDRGRVP
jgi:hypothetical protein